MDSSSREWAVRGALRTLFANQFKKELGLRVDGSGREGGDAELFGVTVNDGNVKLDEGASAGLPTLEECRTHTKRSRKEQAACELQAISTQVQ